MTDIVARSLMPRIAVSRTMPFPRETVWAAVADLGSHHEWMSDARSVQFGSDQRRGVGTRIRVETVIGPVRTIDEIEVVGWVEGESVEVEHKGLIRGMGRFVVSHHGAGTEVEWVEELTFPWYLGGDVTAWMARPVLAAVWRRNLESLEELLRSP